MLKNRMMNQPKVQPKVQPEVGQYSSDSERFLVRRPAKKALASGRHGGGVK